MRKAGKGKVLDDIDEWFNGNRRTTSKSAGSCGGVTMPSSRKPISSAQHTKNIINGIRSAKAFKPASEKSKMKLEKINAETMRSYEKYAQKLPKGNIKQSIQKMVQEDRGQTR